MGVSSVKSPPPLVARHGFQLIRLRRPEVHDCCSARGRYAAAGAAALDATLATGRGRADDIEDDGGANTRDLAASAAQSGGAGRIDGGGTETTGVRDAGAGDGVGAGSGVDGGDGSSFG